MVKVVIKNLSNVETHVGIFENSDQGLAWVYETRVTGAFGKYNRWFQTSELSDEQKSQAVETITNPEGVITNYRLPDDYTVEVIDITNQKIQEAKEAKSAKKIAFGNAMKIYLNALQNDKIDAGIWTAQILESFLASPDIALIERFLGFGALEYSFAKIASSDLSLYYTSQEKIAILDKLDSFIDQIGE